MFAYKHAILLILLILDDDEYLFIDTNKNIYDIVN